jgi:phage I-like protein
MKIVFAKSRPLDLSADGKQPPSEFVWMPAGSHEISAGSRSGGVFKGAVICDAEAARLIADSFQRVLAEGRKSWIDFNHEDAEAAAWVKGFSWDPARGIICHVDWTPEGIQAIQDKRFYSFSPAFSIDPESHRVCELAEGYAAGGLVNAPAFGAAMPELVAAKAADAEEKPIPDAAAQIAALTEELAVERQKRVDNVTEPAVKAGLISRAVADGLRAACKAAPERTDAILAAIPDKKATASAPVIVAPGVEIQAHGATHLDPYDAYMQRLKQSRT